MRNARRAFCIKMSGNALRFALGIFSGKIIIIICGSETSADVSEPLFHRWNFTPSVFATQSQIPPFVTCGDIFPRPGEVGPQGDAFGRCRKLCRHHESRPLGEGGCERSEQTEGVSLGKAALQMQFNIAALLVKKAERNARRRSVLPKSKINFP